MRLEGLGQTISLDPSTGLSPATQATLDTGGNFPQVNTGSSVEGMPLPVSTLPADMQATLNASYLATAVTNTPAPSPLSSLASPAVLPVVVLAGFGLLLVGMKK